MSKLLDNIDYNKAIQLTQVMRNKLAEEIQLEFKIGFVNTLKIIDRLEKDGYLAPSYGIKQKRVNKNITDKKLIDEVKNIIKKSGGIKSAKLIQEKLYISYKKAENILKKIEKQEQNEFNKLIKKAKKLIIKFNHPSASFIQREFCVSFSKAEKILNELRKQGIIVRTSVLAPYEISKKVKRKFKIR